MEKDTQKFVIRLLKKGIKPEDAVAEGVKLKEWPKIEGGLISLGKMGGKNPKWMDFLELSNDQKKGIINTIAYGIVFISTDRRWFAISFGMGHSKLDLSKFVHNFGLKISLNAVDPERLKSADLRTPDENTLSRRSQTSRESNQAAFGIDFERDIVRSIAGKAKDELFSSHVAGTDSFTMQRKIDVGGLKRACADAYKMYMKEDYKEHFGWIDQVKHERDKEIIQKLEDELIDAINQALAGNATENISLAFPEIYNPESHAFIRYKGFRSKANFADLNLQNYVAQMIDHEVTPYTRLSLDSHKVHEVDDQGKDFGKNWKISECLNFETNLGDQKYILSAGNWYCINNKLARDVQKFFDEVPTVSMPDAYVDENEASYNARLKNEDEAYLCLDRKLVKPENAATPIEICDFLTKEKSLVHVKDRTSSSRLSHLFNQGTVSAEVLILDGAARDEIQSKIKVVQNETGQTGFADIIPDSRKSLEARSYTIVYAVLSPPETKKLPFFSLVIFRQSVNRLKALGFKCAFAWIEKKL